MEMNDTLLMDEETIEPLTKMPERTDTTRTVHVTMPCRLGLHARTACMFLRFANQFESSIRVRNGDIEANGKSILGLMVLGACWHAHLEIWIEGPDADRAASEITDYFKDDSHCADD